MTAAKDPDMGSEYCHWEEDASLVDEAVVISPGYDSHNGLRSHTYHSTQPKAISLHTPTANPIFYPPYPPQMLPYQPYAQPTPYAYGMPAHQLAPITYPPPAYHSYPTSPAPANYYVYQPAYVGTSTVAAPPTKGNVWVGRTKAEVDEDNMKLAAKFGASDKRKVVPTGVKDDQMMWCVELDGSHTLRTFISMQELKGEWKKDPRFEDSYYFLRIEEYDENRKD